MGMSNENIQNILNGSPTAATHIDEDGDYWKIVSSDCMLYVGNGRWVTANPYGILQSIADLREILRLRKEIERLRDFADKVMNWQEGSFDFRMQWGVKRRARPLSKFSKSGIGGRR